MTTGDGLEIALTESILPPPVVAATPTPVETATTIPAPAEVKNIENNSSVINGEQPKEPEILVIKLSSVLINPSSFVNNNFNLMRCNPRSVFCMSG